MFYISITDFVIEIFLIWILILIIIESLVVDSNKKLILFLKFIENSASSRKDSSDIFFDSSYREILVLDSYSGFQLQIMVLEFNSCSYNYREILVLGFNYRFWFQILITDNIIVILVIERF